MAAADLVITGTVLTVDDADLDVRATFLAGRQVYGQ